MPRKNTCPLEEHDQAVIFLWRQRMVQTYPDLWLLNGSMNGVRLHPSLRGKMKRLGCLNAGHPDINLPVRRGRYSGLYIELKREKGGTVSQEQKDWLHALEEQGFFACVCKGYDITIEIIEKYLNLKDGEGIE